MNQKRPFYRENGAPDARPYRGPLLVAFVLGCGVSGIASGRFTARLILDGALAFAFVPAIQLIALAIALRLTESRLTSFGHAVESYFAGYRPWLLWILVVTAAFAIVPARQLGPWLSPALFGSVVPLLWSLMVDFRFFRSRPGSSRAGAIRALALQRAIAWSLSLAYFIGIAFWYEVLPEVAQWIRR